MNDEITNNQNNTTTTSHDLCPVCKTNPCVCPRKDDTSLPKTPAQKTRVKGSHRNGKPPKLKWL